MYLKFDKPVKLFPNGSDHTVIACLYEEGEVKYVNGVEPGFLELQLVKSLKY